MSRPPLPPFDEAGARRKVRLAEDAWNSRDPELVAAFLTRKWSKERDYRLIKNLHAFWGDRIAVRFRYEWHDADGRWWRSFGNENWEFDASGLMRRREASINDVPIEERDRLYRWPAPGRRPDDEPEMPDLPW